MTNICTTGLDTGFASLDYLQIGILGIIQGITELLPPGARAAYRFSPDGRWLAFHETTDYFQSRVVIVPVGNGPVPSSDWIVP